MQPDTVGTAPAFRRDQLCGRLRWRMANIFFASSDSPQLTKEEINAALGCVDDALFKSLEKLLHVTSPNSQLREAILDAVAIYLRCPDPAPMDRKTLNELSKYFSDVLQHLLELQELLPANSGRHDVVKSNFLFSILGEERHRFGGHDYLMFKRALDDLAEATKAASARLTKLRVPPNFRYGAIKQFVRQLADIFQTTTGKNPREHVKSNYAKTKYHGEFFQMADEVLTRVGCLQQNATRGRMITRMLVQRSR